MAPMRDDDPARPPFPFTAPLGPLAPTAAPTSQPIQPNQPNQRSTAAPRARPTQPPSLWTPGWTQEPRRTQPPEPSSAALGVRRMTHPPAQAEPITVASVALARLIAQASQRFPQWGGDAIAESCVRLRNDGVPLAPDIAFHANTRLMLQMSHAIEDVIIARRLSCELYVGFQRLSLLNAQASRYAEILASAQYVYAYGLDDAPLADDLLQYTRTLLRFVVQPRHGSDLLWFWFLVVDDPSFKTVLLAQQDSGYLWNRRLVGRSYQGFWSFDPQIVRQITPTLRDAARVLYYT